MELMEWKDRTKFRAKYISPLQELELLAMTFPAKPKSSKQQYYLSEKGRLLLERLNNREST